MSNSTYKTGYFCTHEDHDRNIFVGEFYRDWTRHFSEEHGNEETRPKHKLVHCWTENIPKNQSLKKGDIANCGWVFPGQNKVELYYHFPETLCQDCFDEDTSQKDTKEPERSINLYDEFYANTGWTYARLEKEAKRLDKVLEGAEAHGVYMSSLSQIPSKVYLELLIMVLPALHAGAMYRGHVDE